MYKIGAIYVWGRQTIARNVVEALNGVKLSKIDIKWENMVKCRGNYGLLRSNFCGNIPVHSKTNSI
jgi:hypothetical protein